MRTASDPLPDCAPPRARCFAQTSDETVARELSKFGALKGSKPVLVRQKDTKCFAFVDFEDAAAAKAAIAASANQSLFIDNKPIRARCDVAPGARRPPRRVLEHA